MEVIRVLRIESMFGFSGLKNIALSNDTEAKKDSPRPCWKTAEILPEAGTRNVAQQQRVKRASRCWAFSTRRRIGERPCGVRPRR